MSRHGFSMGPIPWAACSIDGLSCVRRPLYTAGIPWNTGVGSFPIYPGWPTISSLPFLSSHFVQHGTVAFRQPTVHANHANQCSSCLGFSRFSWGTHGPSMFVPSGEPPNLHSFYGTAPGAPLPPITSSCSCSSSYYYVVLVLLLVSWFLLQYIVSDPGVPGRPAWPGRYQMYCARGWHTRGPFWAGECHIAFTPLPDHSS